MIKKPPSVLCLLNWSRCRSLITTHSTGVCLTECVHVFLYICVCTLCIIIAVSSCVVGAGMVVDWEQETGLLMTSGDVRVIRIWDTDREMKVQVLYCTCPGCMSNFLKKGHNELICNLAVV